MDIRSTGAPWIVSSQTTYTVPVGPTWTTGASRSALQQFDGLMPFELLQVVPPSVDRENTTWTPPQQPGANFTHVAYTLSRKGLARLASEAIESLSSRMACAAPLTLAAVGHVQPPSVDLATKKSLTAK